MKNVKLKLTLWGIIIVAGMIFYLQNRSPEVSLIIFGSQTIALPVALWLIISAMAGLITSMLLQLLFGVYSRQSRQQWEDDEDFDFPEQPDEPNDRFASSDKQEANSVPRATQTLQQDWQSPPQREDWNDLDDDDWNIEEPPRRDSNPSPNRNNNIDEVQNPPDKTSNQGSVYSYRYREARREYYDSEEIEEDEEENDNDEEEPNESPKVYEANYRVIRPPLWNLPDEDNGNDDEDDQDKR